MPGGIIRVMKKLSVFLSLALLTGACAAPGQVGTNTPQPQANYPPVIEDSAARQTAVRGAWKQFLAEKGLPESSLELTPVTGTPRALPAELAGRINLNTKQGKLGETELKEALRQFVESSRLLLSGPNGDEKTAELGLKDLSLVSFTNDGGFYRAVYRQVNYPYPIAEGYGELRFAVGKNGELLQMSSTLLPNVLLPTRAEVKPQELRDKMVGREFTYTTFAGRPQSYRATTAEDVQVGGLVIYPKVTGNRMEIHLAFPVTVGQGMTWTVYIDAINGNELGAKQNFAT
jgi:hypothetical protein